MKNDVTINNLLIYIKLLETMKRQKESLSELDDRQSYTVTLDIIYHYVYSI